MSDDYPLDAGDMMASDLDYANHLVHELTKDRDRLRAESERLRSYLKEQLTKSRNLLNSEVDCDFRYEQGCIAALNRVQQFLDRNEELSKN